MVVVMVIVAVVVIFVVVVRHCGWYGVVRGARRDICTWGVYMPVVIKATIAN